MSADDWASYSPSDLIGAARSAAPSVFSDSLSSLLFALANLAESTGAELARRIADDVQRSEEGRTDYDYEARIERLAASLAAMIGVAEPGYFLHPVEAEARLARARAVLHAHQTADPTAWEWGVQGDGWMFTTSTEEDARQTATADHLSVVRRRPAGPWEPVS